MPSAMALAFEIYFLSGLAVFYSLITLENMSNARPNDPRAWVWDGLPAAQKEMRGTLKYQNLATLHAMLAWLKLEKGEATEAGQEASRSLRYSRRSRVFLFVPDGHSRLPHRAQAGRVAAGSVALPTLCPAGQASA